MLVKMGLLNMFILRHDALVVGAKCLRDRCGDSTYLQLKSHEVVCLSRLPAYPSLKVKSHVILAN